MTAFPDNLQMTGVSRPSILSDGFPLLTNSPPDLTENKVVGSYRNVSEYLDVHYDLLSEDFMRPLRTALKEYQRRGSSVIRIWNDVHVRVFIDVTLTSVTKEHNINGEYRYVNSVLEFGRDCDVLEEPAFGSLLVFSRDKFDQDVFLGKVISEKAMSGGTVVEVQLKLPLDQCVQELISCHFTMMQEPMYYTYYHVLKVLNLLNEQSFPLKKYIVYGTQETQVSHPSYLEEFSYYNIFDLGVVPVLDIQEWPPKYQMFDMDNSQISALKAALTKELAVIYGAPGTGKTYLGIRLVKVFLDNMIVWNREQSTPILLVCQSNHALDYFMENVLEYTDRVVRIGDQCQSDKLMQYSLKELVCRLFVMQKGKHSEVLHVRVRSLLNDIDKIRLHIQNYDRSRNTGLVDQRKKLIELENEIHDVWEKLPNRHANSLHVMRSSYVVGLTPTGAAARREYLEELQSPIVIIEDAGEMLEAHLVVSMTEHCRHLILLGDLKQLKPAVNTFHLGRDYNLNISLFERLLTNGIAEGNCLKTQYRMRPEISSLLRPHIYKDEELYDAPITLQKEKIRGLSKNVFFLDHNQCERKAEDNEGCWNPHEVTMLINLACYLVVCGKYLPTDIAIITMYAEQKRKLIEARQRRPQLCGLEISSVDGYLGKEKDIVLLSLVRSNAAKEIGFLKDEGRICVSLSRARTGLYIMGNMECLQRDRVWNNVRRSLEQNGQFGNKLTLHCEEHLSYHQVSKEEDWDLKFCSSCAADCAEIRDPYDEHVAIDMAENPYDHRRDYKYYNVRNGHYRLENDRCKFLKMMSSYISRICGMAGFTVLLIVAVILVFTALIMKFFGKT